MKALVAVVAPTTTRAVIRPTNQMNGTAILTSDVFLSFTTSSLTLVPLFTSVYTIDTQGVINVIDVWFDIITDNSTNGRSVFQISGDGGTTFVTMTGEIPSTANLETSGPGLWIRNVSVGTNQLQIRLSGRSTDGAVATLKVRNDTTFDFIFNKLLIAVTQSFGFVSGGRNISGTNFGSTIRFDDNVNTWFIRADITARRNLAGYVLKGFGVTSGGFTTLDVGTTEKFDDLVNTVSPVASITTRGELAGFSMTTSLGSFGYSVDGRIGAADSGIVERFDIDANTHTPRASGLARSFPTGYAFSGLGFSSCGDISGTGSVGITEKFDDIGNSWTNRTSATARLGPASYAIGNFGFTGGGQGVGAVTLGTTEKFNDTANTHTARTGISPHYRLAGFGMLGFGYTSCGFLDGAGKDGVTQRFDDTANTQTTRQSAIPRDSPTGYNITR